MVKKQTYPVFKGELENGKKKEKKSDLPKQGFLSIIPIHNQNFEGDEIKSRQVS